MEELNLDSMVQEIGKEINEIRAKYDSELQPYGLQLVELEFILHIETIE